MFSRSNHLLMCLSLETLTSIIRTGSPILMTLLRWLTFLLRFQTVILILLLFWIYFFLDTSICSTMAFPLLGNSDHLVVSVSIDFPSNSQKDSLFHCIACGYSCADWDSFVIIRQMFHGRIYLNLVLLLLLVNFVSGFRLELMYISLIENIRSSLIHLHGFQLLVLLP